MIFSSTKRDFGVKIFFLVSQLVSFRLKKQTDKNVADITFKVKHLGVLSPSDNFLSEVLLNTGMLHNPSCLDILKIFPSYNKELVNIQQFCQKLKSPSGGHQTINL